ncbi:MULTISPECIES: hypothetical protein [Prochlorococcus]|uniref:hypothetical protein n=1 Tax=Prochlorococcus TaxID=1218 RepID=UPI000B1CEFDF|nr:MULTISPECIES: hypothetical protein [Prochlorococcus]NMO85137.1 hypothetical protein [Prochlorococcus sp. P1344]NMP07130.1 hypothetical protein [Prochlorococcus sp. P1361]NMP14326.1 hypothetical protein [Prochlorococcus sp.P1363]
MSPAPQSAKKPQGNRTTRLKQGKAWLARLASSEGSQGLSGDTLSTCMEIQQLWLVQAD